MPGPETNAPARAPRLGPRPLALHLGTAALTWLSSRSALPQLMSGSLPWRPELLEAATALRESLNGADPETLAAALDREVRHRLDLFLTGVERYRHHPYRRELPDPPVLWREGSTRLLDYGTEGKSQGAVRRPTEGGERGGSVALFVPSLVNRGYILDLAPDNSLMRWLAGRGIRPLLVDWGRPGPVERGFSLTDYVTGRLEAALGAAAGLARGPVSLIGYCMGGNLALALAQRRPREIRSLALLATPWDFHAERPELSRAVAASAEPLLLMADRLGELSTDTLQALFFLLDPYLAPRKFLRFAGFEPGSVRERAFVALEDWLNDGVPLAVRVARECLLGWYGENTPGRGLWRIAGQPIDPRRIAAPTLVVVPSQDRIVPPPSAEPLARLIPGAKRLQPNLGHIGMMVGGTAESALWQPLADWLAPRKPPPRRRPQRRASSPERNLPSQVRKA